MNNCLICGHDLKKFGEVRSHTILKCLYCGLGQTEKLKAQRNNYHRDETYIKEERLFKNIFLKRVDIICRLKKAGKALEIGCSTGLILFLLNARGWEVTGIEVSQKAAEVAKSRDLDVKTSTFEKINLNDKFDLIILNHTLEHLKNPKGVLQKAFQLLNKNGLIFIDVPNFGGLSAKVLGLNWPLLLPDEHLWHFTEKALKRLLADVGFRIVFIEKSSGIWDYGNPINGIFISLVSFKRRFFNELITAIPSFLITKLGLGTDLMIIAKKN